MNNLKFNISAAAAILMASVSANAAVNVDEDGVGFVGKGDVQSVYDWNNSMLQANAHLIRFKFSGAGTASWTCEGVNPAGNIVRSDVRDQDVRTNAHIGYDPRKNSQGQITGFILTGFKGNATTDNPVGTCGASVGFKVPFQLVSEINYEGSAEPSLKVSIDETTWFEVIKISNGRFEVPTPAALGLLGAGLFGLGLMRRKVRA
jgi:hypothetical protein